MLLVLSQTPLMLFIRNGLSFFSAPLDSIIETPPIILEGVKNRSRTIEELYNENLRLKDKLQESNQNYSDVKIFKDENKKLRISLSLPVHEDHELILAEAFVCDREKYFSELNINKGFNDGIVLDMPVVGIYETKWILLGRISQVYADSSKVLLITSSGFRCAVSIDNYYGAILKGNNSWKVGLEYISPDAQIDPGVTVYTSGMGGIFPKGLYVGKIVEVNQHGNFSSKYASISLQTYPQNINHFYVIKKK